MLLDLNFSTVPYTCESSCFISPLPDLVFPFLFGGF